MVRHKKIQPLQPVVQENSRHDREDLLNRITTRIRQSLELQEILTTTAREIGAFLSMDRVKIYRFCPDASGEVIAESLIGNRLPSMLGLRFPADDIPLQARELFIKARQRVIVDVTSGQKTLNQLDSLETGESLVAEDIRYYPADPCHIEYLTVMGVCASLCIPILHQNNLWGLLACHHGATRQFSERELQIVQLLVDQLSLAIAQSNLLRTARQQADHEATINKISSLLHSPLKLTEIRQTVLEETVKALHGSGGRLYITAAPTGKAAQLYTYGAQPTIPWIEELPFWKKLINCLDENINEIKFDYSFLSAELTASTQSLALERWHSRSQGIVGNVIEADTFNHSVGISAEELGREGAKLKSKSLNASETRTEQQGKNQNFLCTIADIYTEPQLQAVISAFHSTQIRSLLIVPLRYHQQGVGCLTIFRNEIKTETLWAGRCNSEERNLRPRKSFEAWREITQGQAKEWSPEELKLAQSLGIHLYMAVMQKRVEDMIQHQASHDRLTGLPNRLLFDDRLSLALANAHLAGGEMLAVVFLDLDGFKTINDTLGHAVGDQLLKYAANRLKECLRERDLVARWGGDEFTILLSPISCAEDAGRIAQRLLAALHVPFHFEQQELHIKASLGIALAPYDGEDAETLLKNADAAMYRAKQQGRNHYQLYTPALGARALERLLLENQLYKALERAEFLLHYQPQIDVKTGQIVGMEALIRWQSAELGLIAPDQFIPIAEETGLISPIGDWVIQTACAQNYRWQLAGLPPIRIAVNLSARQFQQQNLVRTISQVLAETGLKPRYLELEITESIAMQDVAVTISVLKKLQNMGILISMDDFGTGYSSLSSLKHFPLNTLKIDRSFINDLITDSNDAAIVKAVLALGHGLNLQVIAEGVETIEQLEVLRSVGCDGMQGYLYSKPLSAEAATQLLTINSQHSTFNIQASE